MVTFFTFCAIIGGTVLICQFVLTLVGLGGDHGDLGGADIGHGGGDFGVAGHDVATPEGHDAGGHHGSTWLFGVLSFRTLVAATTFFGLGGLVAESLRQPPLLQIAVATGSGLAAMYSVRWVLRLFSRLTEDGTVRIRRAIGAEATVYLTIPPHRSGPGKVHIRMQGQLMEYPAMTAHAEPLATGIKVLVTEVLDGGTLEVQPLPEPVQLT